MDTRGAAAAFATLHASEVNIFLEETAAKKGGPGKQKAAAGE